MPSDHNRLRQVSDHISRIKAAEYPSIVGRGDSYRIVERPWQDMPEPSKLAILHDSVDWSGVTNRDQAHILLSETDPGKLPDAPRNRLIDAVVGEQPTAEPLSPAATKALGAEIRADEHAARVRDYGEADAATYDARMAEAYGLRAQALTELQPASPPITEAEIQGVERGWPQTDQQDRPVRPLTQQLIQCCQFDIWPGKATIVDFDTSSHLGALQFAIREQLVAPQELDAALGNGQKLTEIAQRGDNPCRYVTFRTSWDEMLPEPEECSRDSQDGKDAFADLLRNARSTPPDTRSDFERLLDEAGGRGKTQSKEQDRGGRER